MLRRRVSVLLQKGKDEVTNISAWPTDDDGIWTDDLKPGSLTLIETKNRVYELRRRQDGKFTIKGHPTYCPDETLCVINGSTWGGSAIRVDWIGRGMCLEFMTKDHNYEDGRNRVITTSVIKSINGE